MSASHQLVVVRHGKAEKSADNDYDRHLTDRGRLDSRATGVLVGVALAGTAGRVVALVSSAARAEETWRELVAALADGVEVAEDVRDDLYQANVETLVELLATTDERVTTVLVVGHDPTMSETVHALAGAGDPDARRRLEDGGLPTAAVAVLSYDGRWAAIEPGSCRLESLEVGRAGG